MKEVGLLIPVDGNDEIRLPRLVERILFEDGYGCHLEEVRIVAYPDLQLFGIGTPCFKGVQSVKGWRQYQLGLNVLKAGRFMGFVLIRDCDRLREMTIGNSFGGFGDWFE